MTSHVVVGLMGDLVQDFTVKFLPCTLISAIRKFQREKEAVAVMADGLREGGALGELARL